MTARFDDTVLARRLDRIESYQAIQQLPMRYAMAVDGRDMEGWVKLFVPNVRVTKETSGREALLAQIVPMVRTFQRSVHQICGHRIELDDTDDDHATGAVYCRAEHEVDERWIVMAICYFDDYRRVDGEWLVHAPTRASLVRGRHQRASASRRLRQLGQWRTAGTPRFLSDVGAVLGLTRSSQLVIRVVSTTSCSRRSSSSMRGPPTRANRPDWRWLRVVWMGAVRVLLMGRCRWQPGCGNSAGCRIVTPTRWFIVAGS